MSDRVTDALKRANAHLAKALAEVQAGELLTDEEALLLSTVHAQVIALRDTMIYEYALVEPKGGQKRASRAFRLSQGRISQIIARQRQSRALA